MCIRDSVRPYTVFSSNDRLDLFEGRCPVCQIGPKRTVVANAQINAKKIKQSVEASKICELCSIDLVRLKGGRSTPFEREGYVVLERGCPVS